MERRPDGADTAERLRARFPDAVLGGGAFRDQHWVELRADRLLEVCAWLRDEPQCAYDVLLDVTAAHWPGTEQPMEVIYHLHSRDRNDRLRLKVRTGDRGPVPSLTPLWASAEWNEREAYDMFGVEFDGHPDLRRILMPDDYTDFPLRKELPLYTA
jgi:NADH-quinone oxidoreductase subunit C